MGLYTSFNTTIVSVELLIHSQLKYLLFCFNTTIVSVEHFKDGEETKTAKVSIQLLFRWNITPSPTSISVTYVSIQLLFRWNLKNNSSIKSPLWFQYNYCFGGTLIQRKTPLPRLVSIQLLFRWNSLLFPAARNFFRVSIQLLFRWNLWC